MAVPAQITPSLLYSVEDGFGGCFEQLPEWLQLMIQSCEELGGERPTVEEITERNVRQATANAIAATEQPRSHRPVGINEPASSDDIEDRNAELAATTHGEPPF